MDTLDLSPQLSLTLGTDALVVNDDSKKGNGCCGLKGTIDSIPFYNILWAEVSNDQKSLVVDYAKAKCKNTLEVTKAEFPIAADTGAAQKWAVTLLDRAYGNATKRKRAWVVVNPNSGPGGADKIWERQAKPIFQAARMPMTVVRTEHPGHGVDLARDINIEDFDIAVPCSGDGLPHEVYNGLAQRPDARRALSKIAVCLVPCGSGNAMSCNLYGTHKPGPAALAIVKGVPTPLDIISITQGDKRYVSFLSQAFGMIADLDITTEHMRWMGQHRFVVGFLKLAMQRKVYPCDIACKVEIGSKQDIKAHYRNNVSRQDGTVSRTEGLAQKGDSAVASGNGSTRSGETGSPVDDGVGLPPLRYGTVNDKLPVDWETVTYENLGNFYCGNMAYMSPDTNFFAAALPSDGLMDLITCPGDISPLKSINMQTQVSSGRFFDNPLVKYQKVSAFRLTPHPIANANDGVISIDGERVPFAPLQAEVHRGLGLTLSIHGGFEAPGPMDDVAQGGRTT